MIKPYFPPRPGDPPPLRVEVRRRVRFEELDPLGIVWHGRYASYFEEARVALGDRYGIGYRDFQRQGVVTPVRQLHLDYLLPLRFEEEVVIEGILHPSEAARLNYELTIRNGRGEVATTGFTVHLMLDREERVLLVPPAFFLEFQARWRRGELP